MPITADYINVDGYWQRRIEAVEAQGERLPYLFCPDCGMLYRASSPPGMPSMPVPRTCEINGAGAVLVPVYALYGDEFKHLE